MPISESTALDYEIVGWEDIELQNKTVKKAKHFNNNMRYKLKLHKMKVNIKWNQNWSNKD